MGIGCWWIYDHHVAILAGAWLVPSLPVGAGVSRGQRAGHAREPEPEHPV